MALSSESLVTGPYANYIHNTLNEVLHGFAVNIEEQFHTGYDTLRALMKELDGADARYRLSPEKAALLLRASELCEIAFGESEFQTRLGYYKSEAHAAMAELRQIAGNAQQAASAGMYPPGRESGPASRAGVDQFSIERIG